MPPRDLLKKEDNNFFSAPTERGGWGAAPPTGCGSGQRPERPKAELPHPLRFEDSALRIEIFFKDSEENSKIPVQSV